MGNDKHLQIKHYITLHKYSYRAWKNETNQNQAFSTTRITLPQICTLYICVRGDVRFWKWNEKSNDNEHGKSEELRQFETIGSIVLYMVFVSCEHILNLLYSYNIIMRLLICKIVKLRKRYLIHKSIDEAFRSCHHLACEGRTHVVASRVSNQ